MNPYFTGLRPDSRKIFWKAAIIVISFLSFKGRTQAYLPEMSLTHSKNQVILLNLHNNCISAKSSIKDECTFRFSNFLIACLRDSLANSLFGGISTVPPGFFYQNINKPLR